jgi:hypothetical protein
LYNWHLVFFLFLFLFSGEIFLPRKRKKKRVTKKKKECLGTFTRNGDVLDDAGVNVGDLFPVPFYLGSSKQHVQEVSIEVI